MLINVNWKTSKYILYQFSIIIKKVFNNMEASLFEKVNLKGKVQRNLKLERLVVYVTDKQSTIFLKSLKIF